MDVLLKGGLTKNIMSEIIFSTELTRDTFLSEDVLVKLGFSFDGDSWYHEDDEFFAVKFEDSCYCIYYHAYKANLQIFTVSTLEKVFYERTGKLLY